MDKNNKSIQVLNRAFEILKIIKSEKSTKMSLGKIAKLANLPRSTVQRIVNSPYQPQQAESQHFL